MNILTDILSLIKQDKYASSAADDDVTSNGLYEPPDMLGIASPVPYKSVKVIKLKDLQIPAQICTYVNVPRQCSVKHCWRIQGDRYNNKSANLHSQVA